MVDAQAPRPSATDGLIGGPLSVICHSGGIAATHAQSHPTPRPSRRRPLEGLPTARLRRRHEAGALGSVHARAARPAGHLAPPRLRPGRGGGGRGMVALGRLLPPRARAAAAAGNFAGGCRSTGRSITTPCASPSRSARPRSSTRGFSPSRRSTGNGSRRGSAPPGSRAASVNVLNLFGYTGAATCAAAARGRRASATSTPPKAWSSGAGKTPL